MRYDCDPSKAAALAAHATLMIGAGRHLTSYLDGTLRNDARTALRSAFADMIDARSAAPAGSSMASSIADALDAWRADLAKRRSAPARRPDGQAVLDELEASSQLVGTRDELDAVVTVIADGCASLYEGAWPATVELVAATCGAHPRGERDPYGLSGIVREQGDAIEVRLQIHLDTFGPGAFAALPGLVAHECVSHVAAGATGPASNESPFAEGFMDWAASYWLEAWYPRLPGELGATAVDNHEQHRKIVTSGTSYPEVARKTGRQAAGRLVMALVSHHGYEVDDAKLLIGRLAARLNVNRARLVAKDAWTNAAYLRKPEEPLDASTLAVIKGGQPPSAIFDAFA